MKVAMISRLFPNVTEPTFGQFNLQIARALQSQCSLEVIAPVPNLPGKSSVPARTSVDGLVVRHPRFFAVPLLNRLIAGQCMLSCLEQLRLEADALLATFAWPDGYAAVRLGLPVVVKTGGSDIDLLPASGMRRQQTIFALQRCRRIYVVAQSLRDKVVALGLPAEKIAVIHNGVDPAVFHPRDLIEVRRTLGLTEKDRVIIYVGWIEPDKGVEYLLRAHSQMSPRPLLVLVGRGFAERDMQGLTQSLGTAERCRFVGEQPHAKIADWMNAADVFAFPSLHEGCPNVVLEALACGLPMVATNVGGIPEITPRAPWCELVPPRDSNAFAAALDRVLAGRWNRMEISRATQRTWDDVAHDVFRLFQPTTHSAPRTA